ncbi:MAG TPA: DUF433 domain-containing protein [Tepidiformaceae bacterium]|nr:DUF433 domain-containing protein [Tepidiformaceae bacterium]HMO96459.1 DUF433 domain-containing protein [Tepidiformaceae bacterium]
MAAATIDIQRLLEIDPRDGQPVVRGTRLRVETLVGLHLQGLTADQIAGSYSEITLPAVYAALAYYYKHQDQMDTDHVRSVAEALAEAHALGIELV